ncbi:MAG: arginase family protein [Bacteroidota bacterium]
MQLFIPQWQGSGKGISLEKGAWTIRDYLGGGPFTTISLSEIPAGADGLQRFNINNYDAIAEQLSRLKALLEEKQPQKLSVLGGDCGLEIVPVSYLNSKYSNLGVIWFDAHADINTPSDSPSKNFHGMPLRMLLGEGVPEIERLLFSKLKDHQLHYLGLRDVDDAEHQRIRSGNIYNSRQVNTADLVQTLKAKNIRQLYLHFDLDCLDPKEYDQTYYQVPDGIAIATAERCIRELKDKFEVVGTSVLESVATDTNALQPITALIAILLK